MIASGAGGTASGGPIRILVVEDESHVRDGIVETLRSAGYEVATAGDGKEALPLVAEQQFDAIISGILMPHMDGMEFFEHLQEEYPSSAARVLFMTDWADRAPVEIFLAQSGRPCLDKPVGEEALLRILQEIMTASTARASRRVSRSTLTPFTPEEAAAIRQSFKETGRMLECPRCSAKLESGTPLGGGHSIATVWLLQCPSCMRSMILRDLNVQQGGGK